jgi:hypothetical protein
MRGDLQKNTWDAAIARVLLLNILNGYAAVVGAGRGVRFWDYVEAAHLIFN